MICKACGFEGSIGYERRNDEFLVIKGRDGDGWSALIATGIVHATYPAQYPHECNMCGATKIFRAEYPRMTYKPRAT